MPCRFVQPAASGDHPTWLVAHQPPPPPALQVQAYSLFGPVAAGASALLRGMDVRGATWPHGRR